MNQHQEVRVSAVGFAQVMVQDRTLAEAEVDLMRQSVCRQLTEISGKIYKNSKLDMRLVDEVELVKQRRLALELMDRFDGVIVPMEMVENSIKHFEINGRRLGRTAYAFVRESMKWYRDHWEQKDVNQQILGSLIDLMSS